MDMFKKKDTDIFSVHRFDVDGQISYASSVVMINKKDFYRNALEAIGCKHLEGFPFKYKGASYAVWFDKDIDSQPELPLPSLIVGEPGTDEKCILIFGHYIITRINEYYEIIGLTDTEAATLHDFAMERSRMAAIGQGLGLFPRQKSA